MAQVMIKWDFQEMLLLPGDFYTHFSKYHHFLPGFISFNYSFGKIYNKKDRDKARIEDLARSALVTTTNNIGSIAFNGAETCGIDRIVFVGNFS